MPGNVAIEVESCFHGVPIILSALNITIISSYHSTLTVTMSRGKWAFHANPMPLVQEEKPPRLPRYRHTLRPHPLPDHIAADMIQAASDQPLEMPTWWFDRHAGPEGPDRYRERGAVGWGTPEHNRQRREEYRLLRLAGATKKQASAKAGSGLPPAGQIASG